MSFRFRKSIRIMPGVRVNVGKRGASVSVGTRGARTTVGKKGTRTTMGLPGSGLSFSEFHPRRAASSPQTRPAVRGWLVVVLLIVVALAWLLS